MNDPDFFNKHIGERDWQKFQVHGLYASLLILIGRLPQEEKHFLEEAAIHIKPLIEKWNAEREGHPEDCHCGLCLDKHPVLR